MTSLPATHEGQSSSTSTIIALGCHDGHVLVYADQTLLFSVPRVGSLHSEMASPRPVDVAFAPLDGDANPPVVRVTVLYTSGQLAEWTVKRGAGAGAAVTTCDAWLQDFWRQLGPRWCMRMPPCHSIEYAAQGQWVLGSSRFLVYIDRAGVCFPRFSSLSSEVVDTKN